MQTREQAQAKVEENAANLAALKDYASQSQRPPDYQAGVCRIVNECALTGIALARIIHDLYDQVDAVELKLPEIRPGDGEPSIN